MPMSMGGQNTQLLGNQQNNPQMMRMLMGMSGQGGFGHGMQGPTMGPVHQGPLGAAPPQPNQGGF